MSPSQAGERERLIGFAFAAADVLIEADDAGCVTFATGALGRMALPDADTLVGARVSELLCDRDRPLLEHLLEELRNGGRRGPVVLRHLSEAVAAQWSLLRTPGSDRVYAALRTLSSEQAAGAPRGVDPTTGLLEGDAFMALAERQLARMLETDQRLELSLIRLVGLEGSPSGIDGPEVQSLLKRVAVSLRGLSQSGDDVAHVGEGRFAMLHGPDAALRVENAIEATLEDAGIAGVGVERRVLDLRDPSLSAGQAYAALRHTIERFQASGAIDVDHLADALTQKLAHTAARVADAREVIDTRGFYIVYQPIVSLATGVVHHSEALTRLSTNDMGIFDFVTFAEEIGFVSDFDLAVTREVLNKLAEAKRRRRRPSVAVNLSARSLQNPHFVDRLLALCAHAEDTASQLLFEITESFQIVDLASANESIQRLRQAGFPVCLDDFGAGAAAFHYIRALKVDFVKLDGAFVQRAERSERDHAVLRGMVDLCRSLEVETIAEMVETEACASIMRDMGVDQAQGFLFGRAVSDPALPTERPRRGATV